MLLCAGPIPTKLGVLSELNELWLNNNFLTGEKRIMILFYHPKVSPPSAVRGLTRALAEHVSENKCCFYIVSIDDHSTPKFTAQLVVLQASFGEAPWFPSSSRTGPASEKRSIKCEPSRRHQYFPRLLEHLLTHAWPGHIREQRI